MSNSFLEYIIYARIYYVWNIVYETYICKILLQGKLQSSVETDQEHHMRACTLSVLAGLCLAEHLTFISSQKIFVPFWRQETVS